MGSTLTDNGSVLKVRACRYRDLCVGGPTAARRRLTPEGGGVDRAPPERSRGTRLPTRAGRARFCDTHRTKVPPRDFCLREGSGGPRVPGGCAAVTRTAAGGGQGSDTLRPQEESSLYQRFLCEAATRRMARSGYSVGFSRSRPTAVVRGVGSPLYSCSPATAHTLRLSAGSPGVGGVWH